jgi:hypothetical protein
MVALRALEVGDLEERIVSLEKLVHADNVQHTASAFDTQPGLLEDGEKEAK